MLALRQSTKKITSLVRLARTSATNVASSSKELRRNDAAPVKDIEIPLRIKRGPTDILKALASTVDKDYTAAHYKFHDDPYFFPASNAAKRIFALSKESGRKAARWIRDEYPDGFLRDHAQPQIEAFISQQKFQEDSDVSEETLLDCIDTSRVSDAMTVYNLLQSKGVEVDKATKQSLFELLCFYNCEDPTCEDFIEERWFRQTVTKEGRKTWLDSGLAESLFKESDPNDAASHATMIRGLIKYFRGERAFKLYETMLEKGMAVDVETYNALIRTVYHLKETSESRWQLVEELMTSMHRDGLVPNLGTLNAALESISRMGSYRDAKKLALQTLAEMKNLGVEPSLASYHFLLVLFCRERGPVSTILYDIMKILNGQEFEIRDSKDILFFVNAMDVCHTHLQDKNLAFQVNALLNTGNNYNLIGDSLRESIYYQHFFKLLCGTENLDSFFEFYNKLVPQVYTPEPSVMLDIIRAVELNGALHYLPQLWSDIVTFDQTGRENLIDSLLSILGKNKVEEELQKKFAEIAWDVKTRVDTQSPSRINVLRWTGPMLGNVMLACLNADEYEKACTVLEKCVNEQHKISAPPLIQQLQSFAKIAIERKDLDKATECVRLAYDIGYMEASDIAKEILTKLEPDARQRSALESFTNIGLEEKNE